MSTRDLTRESGLTNDLVGYHMGRLKERGYVDENGTKDVGAPFEAKVYEITDAGREHAQEILGELQQEAKAEGVDGSEVRELREKMEYMEDQIDALFDQIDELGGTVEDHREMYEHFLNR